jgi:hypothetical protein
MNVGVCTCVHMMVFEWCDMKSRFGGMEIIFWSDFQLLV